MKIKLTADKNLSDYSKPELIQLLTDIENKYNSKTERLNKIVSKLSNARQKIKSQKTKLQYLRKRVVELTPADQSRS